jgi:hypothetical protein
MKNLFLLISLLTGTLVFAQNDSINPERVSYEFFSGKSIDIIKNEGSIYPEMISGDKIVFKYSKQNWLRRWECDGKNTGWAILVSK